MTDSRREQLEYLVVGLMLFGCSENQVLGILNILPTEELREELIDWMKRQEEIPTPSDLILKAVEIEQSHVEE